MKNYQHYMTYITVAVLLGVSTLSPIGFASSDNSSDDVRASINKKLEEFTRIQNAIKSVETMDQVDSSGADTKFSTKEAAERASNLGKDVD